MRQAQSTATKLVSAHSVSSHPRKSFFGAILDALPHSRRVEGERTLHRYRNLFERAARGIAAELRSHSGYQHSRNEPLLPGEPTVKVGAFTEMMVVATTLIVFLLAHLFAAAILQRSELNADGPSQYRPLKLYE